ncbi:glycosyltransferase [Streptomyces sp. NPDC048330]|uniref:glycosyltransferase n=1 Tax=Streptomyces sp. NPDC048330 TaxID=3365533 RepID=UPI0037173D6C
MPVDVDLLSLDEAEALPCVVRRIPDGWRAVVVDKGSTHRSAALAAELGATVVQEPPRGFGAACHAGLIASDAEFVCDCVCDCDCDCDASLDPGLLPRPLTSVTDGSGDLVLGRCWPTAPGAWPVHARAGDLALSRTLHQRTGRQLHDLGVMRVARREALFGLGPWDRRSGYPLQMVVRAADTVLRVAETIVPYLPWSGKSMVTGTWPGTWHAVRDMRKVLADPPAAAPEVPA